MASKTEHRRKRKTMKMQWTAALVVVVGLIVVYFIVHWKRRPGIPPERKEIAQQKVEVQEKVEFFDFKGNMQINAERRYLGEDNLYHLEGNVRIVDKGKKVAGISASRAGASPTTRT